MNADAPPMEEGPPAQPDGRSAPDLPLALRSRSFRSDRIAWAVFVASLVLGAVYLLGYARRVKRPPGELPERGRLGHTCRGSRRGVRQPASAVGREFDYTLRANEKGIAFSCCIPPDVPDALVGDQVRLRKPRYLFDSRLSGGRSMAGSSSNTDCDTTTTGRILRLRQAARQQHRSSR